MKNILNELKIKLTRRLKAYILYNKLMWEVKKVRNLDT